MQVNFPVMISVDWLSLSCKSRYPLGEVKFDENVSSSMPFIWELQSYGNRQYRKVFNIDVVNADGELTPFGTLQCEPTLDSWSPLQCSLKLANHILYQDGEFGWQQLLPRFLSQFDLHVDHISRCDLAGDFIYLCNRVSGAQLAQKIKSCTWWKLGTVKVCEYYRLPYSVKATEDAFSDIYNPEIYWQDNEFVSRTESMTFGSMASGAQVCLYDKTLELSRSEVEIEIGGEKVRESAKEYIRDAWKEAKVYDPKRHTWRIEIRLRNGALFMSDSKVGELRPLFLDDIMGDKLAYTFLAASDKYFAILDPTEGGKFKMDRARVLALQTHKSRLPRVRLFNFSSLLRKMIRRPIHKAANAHNRAVINRVEKLAEKARLSNDLKLAEDAGPVIKKCLDALQRIGKSQEIARAYLAPVVTRLNILIKDIYNDRKQVSQADLEAIINAKDMLTAHLRTEAPRFTKSVANSLKSLELSTLQSSRNEFYRVSGDANGFEDSVVLREAADILKQVYSSTLREQRRADYRQIFTTWIEQAFTHILAGGRVTSFVFNRIKFCFSELSPISYEKQVEYRKLYNSKILLTIFACRNYREYEERMGLAPNYDD